MEDTTIVVQFNDKFIVEKIPDYVIIELLYNIKNRLLYIDSY